MKVKTIFYRIIALSLAVLLFGTSASISMDMHFCGGKLKNVSFVGKAKACHEAVATQKSSCPLHAAMEVDNQNDSIDRKGCCDQETKLIDSDQDLHSVATDLKLAPATSYFILALVSAFGSTNFAFAKKAKPSFHYVPPNISRAYSVLYQTFRL